VAHEDQITGLPATINLPFHLVGHPQDQLQLISEIFLHLPHTTTPPSFGMFPQAAPSLPRASIVSLR
jgi:hypothetical protein